MYPEVINYGEFSQESFANYYKRWPTSLNNIPKCIVEHWIYRHREDFQQWIQLRPHEWKYELKEFSNEEILTISHIYDWIKNLHDEGKEYVSHSKRSETWLAQYMLENGTTPVPIIVGNFFGNIKHPKAHNSCNMKEPYQLLEGHSRLGCLFGMIDSRHPNLKTKHKVWVCKTHI